MNTPPPAWSRLVDAARRAPADARDVAAPYGFATRVAALAFVQAAAERPLATLFDRLSFRALGLAGLVAAASMAANLPPVLDAIEEEYVTADPVAEMLEVS